MFESAELGHKISKELWKKEVPLLREGLLDAQLDLHQAKKFPVIILVAGVDCAGKGETVNLLNEWMDPRHVETHALRDLTDEELERPQMWRYWRVLPPGARLASSSAPGTRRRYWKMSTVRSRTPTWTSSWNGSSVLKRCSAMRVRWFSSSGCTCQRMNRRKSSSILKKIPRPAGELLIPIGIITNGMKNFAKCPNVRSARPVPPNHHGQSSKVPIHAIGF